MMRFLLSWWLNVHCLIPLVGSYNTRNNRALLPTSFNTFDQRFVNFIPQLVTSALGTTTVYQEKRQGAETLSTPNAGKNGGACHLWIGAFDPVTAETSFLVTAWTTSTTLAQLYYSTTNLTNLGGFDALSSNSVQDVIISESMIDADPVVVFSIFNQFSNPAFLAAYYSVAMGTATSFVGDLHSNTTVDGIASTTVLRAGQLVTHASIPAGTRIQSVDTANAITLTAAATGTASVQTIAKELVAKIIDAQLPSNGCGGFAHLDGWTFIMGMDGSIYNSDLNGIASWTAGNKIPCNAYPGGGVRVVRYTDYVVGFCRGHLQFFTNAGRPSGSPLVAVPNGAFRIGVSAARNIGVAGDTVAFIGTETGGGPLGLYLLNGVGYKKISSPTLNKILNTNAPVTSWSLDVFSINGQVIIGISNTSATSNTFCYCVEANSVFEWNPGTLEWPSYCTNGVTGALYFTCKANTTGMVYMIDPRDTSPQFTDVGASYTGTIIIGPLHNEKPCIVPRLDVIGDTQASTSNLSVSVMRDVNVGFETARTMDLSTARKRLHRLGLFPEGISLKLEHSANTPCRLQGINMPGLQEMAS